MAIIPNSFKEEYHFMRFKKALSAFLAAAVAMTSVVFVTPVVAGAAGVEKVPDGTEEVLATFTSESGNYTQKFVKAWENGESISVELNNLEELAKDENVFIKLTASDLGTITTGDKGEYQTPFGEVMNWGWNSYSGWVSIGKLYKNWGDNQYEDGITFAPLLGSTADLAYSYVPLSEFPVSGSTLEGNFQAGSASKSTLESLEIVRINTVEFETTTLNPSKNAEGNEVYLNIGTDLNLTKLSENAKLRYTFTTTADGSSVTAGWGCGAIGYASESAPDWWESTNQIAAISSPGPETQGTIEVKCSAIPADTTKVVAQLYTGNGVFNKVELLDVKSEVPEPTTYSVTVADTTNGTVVADKTAKVAAGETVTLTVTPAENFKLNTLNAATATVDVTVSSTSAANKFTFEMPAADVTVTAAFKVDAAAIMPAPVAEPGDGEVTLTWKAIAGATKYAVALYNNGKYTVLTNSLTATTYTAKELTNDTGYQFLVQAYVDGVWSEASTEALVKATPVAPADTKPHPIVAAGENKVLLVWAAVDNATKYSVALYSNGKYTILTNDLTEPTYTVNDLEPGTYEFLVQAYVNGKWSAFTAADHVSATVKGPSKPAPEAVAGNGKVTLTWAAIDGATKYAVSVCIGGKYYVQTNTLTDTTYTVSPLTNGKTYRFLVQAYVDNKWSAYTDADLVSATPTGASRPQPLTTAGNGKVTLDWIAIPNATKYAVSVYSGGKYYVQTTELTDTTYTVTPLTNGKTYQFLVQAYVDGKWTSFTAADLVSETPISANQPLPEATPGNRQVTLSWDAISGATKYAVSVYSNGKYYVQTTELTDTTYVVSPLTNGRTYQFLVQAYVDGKWTKASAAFHISATPVA